MRIIEEKKMKRTACTGMSGTGGSFGVKGE